jgi:hypothetical protein
MAAETDHHVVGRAIDAWSSLEGWLFFLFSKVLHIEIDYGYAIMASFNGAGPKRELFERIVKLTPMSKRLRSVILELCKEFGRLTAQRNKIVHGEWHHLNSGAKYRVGLTKHLRYFDQFNMSGEDPQKAVFTVEKIAAFTAECEKVSLRFSELCEDEEFAKKFPYV